jgi:hypothetical protein
LLLPTKHFLPSTVFPPLLDDVELEAGAKDEDEGDDKVNPDECRNLLFLKYFCECVLTCSAVLVFNTPAISLQLFPNL